MGWYNVKNINPSKRVVCKSLTNTGLHTFRGMIGYFLKDIGIEHFEVVMKNILDDDIVEGKTLHAIHGMSDLKFKVVLTHKNVIDHMYVWHKYKTKWHMIATFMSVLTKMCRSGLFIPVALWIIPFNGQGMDHKQMCYLFKIMIDPIHYNKEDVCQVFMKWRQYGKGRYFDDNGLVHDENKEFVDADVHSSTYIKSLVAPFMPVKMENIFGKCNDNLGTALFPQRFPPGSVANKGADPKGKRKLFEIEPLAPPPDPL